MMTPDQLRQYLDVLAKAAKPLGDKATLYYGFAVKQQYFEALEYALMSLAGLGLMFAGWWLFKWGQKMDSTDSTLECSFLCFCVMLVSWVVSACIICSNVPNAFSHYFNAPYWAIKAMIP